MRDKKEKKRVTYNDTIFFSPTISPEIESLNFELSLKSTNCLLKLFIVKIIILILKRNGITKVKRIYQGLDSRFKLGLVEPDREDRLVCFFCSLQLIYKSIKINLLKNIIKFNK